MILYWKPKLAYFSLSSFWGTLCEAVSGQIRYDGHPGANGGEDWTPLVTDHVFFVPPPVGSCSTHQLRSRKWASCNVRRFVRRSQFPVKHCVLVDSVDPADVFNWDKSPLTEWHYPNEDLGCRVGGPQLWNLWTRFFFFFAHTPLTSTSILICSVRLKSYFLRMVHDMIF